MVKRAGDKAGSGAGWRGGACAVGVNGHAAPPCCRDRMPGDDNEALIQCQQRPRLAYPLGQGGQARLAVERLCGPATAPPSNYRQSEARSRRNPHLALRGS